MRTVHTLPALASHSDLLCDVLEQDRLALSLLWQIWARFYVYELARILTWGPGGSLHSQRGMHVWWQSQSTSLLLVFHTGLHFYQQRHVLQKVNVGRSKGNAEHVQNSVNGRCIQVSVIGETANIIGSEPWGSSAYWHLSGLLQFVVLTFGGLEVAGSIFVKKCPEVSST